MTSTSKTESSGQSPESNDNTIYELETLCLLKIAIEELMDAGKIDQYTPLQIAEPFNDHNKPVTMLTGIAIGTVGDLGLPGERSTYDNKYHADDVVILADSSPFGADGAVAYEWADDGTDKPLYGKDGPTKLEDQMAPEQGDCPCNASILSALNNVKQYEEHCDD